MGNRRTLVGSALIIATIVGAAFYVSGLFPQQANGQDVIFRTSWQTSTVTAFLGTTYTDTAFIPQTQTIISYQTLTAPFPSSVGISGTVTTSVIGSSPTAVVFSSNLGGQTTAPVIAGSYSVNLTNYQNYHISIQYSALPIGGSCAAGLIVLYEQDQSITANLSC